MNTLWSRLSAVFFFGLTALLVTGLASSVTCVLGRPAVALRMRWVDGSQR